MRHSPLMMLSALQLPCAIAQGIGSPPKALVYRGPAVCEGCAEAVGELLESSPWKFHVTYVGPDEDVDVDKKSLEGVQVYAHGGGPDLDDAFKRVGKYKDDLQDFVKNGGHYLGFCLGAYLAGTSPGYDLLPEGGDVDSERSQPDAQVTSEEDTVIQVDWTFVSGQTEKNKWLYFQDGAVITGLDEDKLKRDHEGRILAKYSKNGDVAASVTKYGKGWVGLVGPHPEATEEWYDAYDFQNPDGIDFKFGYDFLDATLNGGKHNSSQTTTGATETPTPTVAAINSTAAGVGQGQMNPLNRVMKLAAKALPGHR
ncbi:hypothetical protein FDECE_2591 [Fusarium decemcellulare]|nr:hypothetical protein FDECE_2591 [Fusarium decemcellulare]